MEAGLKPAATWLLRRSAASQGRWRLQAGAGGVLWAGLRGWEEVPTRCFYPLSLQEDLLPAKAA